MVVAATNRGIAYVLPVTHSQRVTRLYRSALKNLMNWCVHRDLFISESFAMRDQFRANMNLKDPRLIEKLVSDAEAKLVEYRHPDPYTRACLRLPAPPIFFVAHLRLWIFCRKVLSCSPFRDTFASCLTLIPVFLAQSRTCPAAASTCATRTTAWACRRR